MVMVLAGIFRCSPPKKERQTTNCNLLALSVSISMIANIFACASSFPGALSGAQFRQYNDVTFGSHIYRMDLVTAENGPGASSADFELWDCDSLGLICSDIHDEDVSEMAVYGDIKSVTAHLSASSNSISMELNGKAIYIYMPHQ